MLQAKRMFIELDISARDHPGMSVTDDEFSRQRAERRRLRELDAGMRIANEAAIRTVLDEYHPSGIPDDLVERVCRIQNNLIREIVRNEKVIREMHDGINRISNEAEQRWVDGFRECTDQIRRHAAELGLSEAVVQSLLRNDMREQDKAAKNEAATRQVEWKRN